MPELLDHLVLTPAEVADVLRVSKKSVYRLCEAGAIPGALRLGRLWRVPRWGLEQLLAERERPPAAQRRRAAQVLEQPPPAAELESRERLVVRVVYPRTKPRQPVPR